MNQKSKDKKDEKEPFETELDEEGAQSTNDEKLSFEEQLEQAIIKAEENWDKYLRAVAEMENIRKRSARDIENARKYSIESFAKEVITVVDTFEMSMESDDLNIDDLVSGNKSTMQLIKNILEQFGVTMIDPHGEPFNPEFHEAMSMQQSDKLEPGTVVTVYQKGYTLNDRLLRPARVVVATEPEEK